MKKTKPASAGKRQLIEKSNSTVVLVLAAAAFVLVFCLVILNFLWDLNGHNRRVISSKDQAAKILENNVQQIPELVTSFNVFEAGEVKSSDALDALPSKYDYPALATSMESLVSRSGLVLVVFSGDDEEESAIQSETDPNPIEIEFTLQVEGTYANVQKFIENLQKTTRPITVKNIEMKGSDSNMKVTLDAVTYYQPATDLNVETRTIE